jgi:hypothetical protein
MKMGFSELMIIMAVCLFAVWQYYPQISSVGINFAQGQLFGLILLAVAGLVFMYGKGSVK